MYTIYVLCVGDNDTSSAQCSNESEESEGDLSSDSTARNPSIPSTRVKLTNPIRSDDNGLNLLRRGRRDMQAGAAVIHHDIWDRVLCEGVPVSLRELVSLVCAQLQVNDDRCRHKLLQCRWTLGWHVTHTTESGLTKHYWGGGVTPNTTSNYRRGDWVEIAGQEMCRGVLTSRLARMGENQQRQTSVTSNSS